MNFSITKQLIFPLGGNGWRHDARPISSAPIPLVPWHKTPVPWYKSPMILEQGVIAAPPTDLSLVHGSIGKRWINLLTVHSVTFF